MLVRVLLAGPVRSELLSGAVSGLPTGVDWVAGGAPVSELAVGLAAAGHEVHVATLGADVEDDVVVAGDGITVHVGTYRREGRARDAFRVERAAVTRAVRRAAPDVAHAHWTYEFALGVRAAGVPWVVTVHDWAPTILRFDPQPYRVVRLGMAAVVLARAGVCTAPSPYLARLVTRVARRPCTVVPNAVPDGSVVERLDAWPRDPEAPLVLAVNVGWGERKNVATLLESFVSVRERVPGARLRLVGPDHGPDGPAAERVASLALPPGSVELVGPVTHDVVLQEMAAADVFAHPAKEESFGMVLAEAMGVGTPVVAGADSGATAWVCGRDGARLVDVTDPAALADGVVAVLHDRGGTEARRRAGLDRVRSEFVLSRVVESYLEVYARVLEGGRP